MQKIPLHYYIAFNNPNGAASVMKDFGYEIHARNKEGLASTIAQFIHREGEKGLEAIASVHPDRELILSTAGTKMGMDGFADSDTKSPALPATGKDITAAPTTNHLPSNYTPLIVIGGIFTTAFLVLAIIAKK